jgi:hypothetical protein
MEQHVIVTAPRVRGLEMPVVFANITVSVAIARIGLVGRIHFGKGPEVVGCDASFEQA